jgi:hypothetical protein
MEDLELKAEPETCPDCGTVMDCVGFVDGIKDGKRFGHAVKFRHKTGSKTCEAIQERNRLTKERIDNSGKIS